MSWFSKAEPMREQEDPPIVRLASAEFVSALVEQAEFYERRAKERRASVEMLASDLSRQTNFNYGDLDRKVAEIRGAILSAINAEATASEIRGSIQDYEWRGARPPYMPPLPIVTDKTDKDGE